MRIAFFTDVFFPLVSGVTTVTADLAKGLADKGHKVYIICPKINNSKEFKYKNIKVVRLKGIPALIYPDFKLTSPFSYKIFDLIKKERIDIIHFQITMPLGIQAIFLSKLLGIPLVGTFHTFFADPDYLKHANLDYKFVENASWWYARQYYNRCDLITCPTISVKKEMIKHRFNKNIKIISNGIDLKNFKRGNGKLIKKRYRLDDKVILFFGRIAYEKNIKYLLECFKLVLKDKPNVKLMIVGGGPQLSKFKDNTKELGIEKNVVFTGMVNYKELPSYIVACDLFATASTTETFGLTTIESQAMGLPSVCVNARGSKDVVKDGFNGYLIKPGDKKGFADRIIKLLSKDNLRIKMGKNAVKESKKYNNKRIVNIWEKEYKKLLKSNS